MNTPVLQISGLSKFYGSMQAVNGLELTVARGQVYGILGPNGSGKTTTLGMILGIINPTAGNFSWFKGLPLQQALQKVGSIIETPSFYPYMTAEQNLKLVANIKQRDSRSVDNLLRRVGLFEWKKYPFKNFSLGMKQRLALAATLIGEPEVLVLDEPTNGMDPQGIADIRNLIIEIASHGTTILLASHLLDEVQKTCSHVAVISKGRKIFDGSVHEIIGTENLLEIWSDDPGKLLELLKQFKGIESIETERELYVIKLGPGPTKKDLHKFLIENGMYPTHFVARAGTLEHKFLDLLKTS